MLHGALGLCWSNACGLPGLICIGFHGLWESRVQQFLLHATTLGSRKNDVWARPLNHRHSWAGHHRGLHWVVIEWLAHGLTLELILHHLLRHVGHHLVLRHRCLDHGLLLDHGLRCLDHGLLCLGDPAKPVVAWAVLPSRFEFRGELVKPLTKLEVVGVHFQLGDGFARQKLEWLAVETVGTLLLDLHVPSNNFCSARPCFVVELHLY